MSSPNNQLQAILIISSTNNHHTFISLQSTMSTPFNSSPLSPQKQKKSLIPYKTTMPPLLYFLVSLIVLILMIYGGRMAVTMFKVKDKQLTNFVVCGTLIAAYITWGIFFLANLNPVEKPRFD